MKLILMSLALAIVALARSAEERSLAPPPENTTVSATLDIPHVAGRNLIWCNTFQLAWNALGKDFCGEPLRLEGAAEFEQAMNASKASARDVDEKSVLVKVGKLTSTFLTDLNAELKKRFGDNAPPPVVVPAIPKAGSVMAYAYLFKNLAFVKPLDKQTLPLVWKGTAGNDTPLEAFGLVSVNSKSLEAAKQIVIWDYSEDKIVELKTASTQDRLILAQIVPGTTLRDTVEKVRQRIAHPAHNPFALYLSDRCLIPCVNIALDRTYSEIVGKNILNEKLKDGFIGAAQQSIFFTLDEKGAVLKSEAQLLKMKNGHEPRIIDFNRPFLLYLERANWAENPYLAIWFENPNLFAIPR